MRQKQWEKEVWCLKVNVQCNKTVRHISGEKSKAFEIWDTTSNKSYESLGHEIVRNFIFILEQQLTWLGEIFLIYSAIEDAKMVISSFYWLEDGNYVYSFPNGCYSRISTKMYKKQSTVSVTHLF